MVGTHPNITFSAAGRPLYVGSHRWTYWDADDGLDVRVQVRVDGGPPYPAAVHIQRALDADARPITGSTLRVLQMGRLEQALQHPALIATLLSDDAALPDFRPEACTPEQARDLVKSLGTTSPAPGQSDLSLRIPRRGEPKEAFLKEVTDLYAETRRRSPRAAAEIAKANGVVTSTVHGWLKEAKRRKALQESQET